MFVTFFLLFLLTLLLYKLLFSSSFWSSLEISEAPGLPFFGNLLPVVLKKKAYFEVMDDLYNSKPGVPYIGIYNLVQPTLMIRDPELMESMLKMDAGNFEDHGLEADLSDPLSLNLFYLKGELWKWTRSKLRSSFSISSIKTFYPGIKDCTDRFLEGFEGSINLRPAMDEFACEVIAKVVFCVDDRSGFIENSKLVFGLSGLSGIRVLFRMFMPRLAIAFGIKVVPKYIEQFYRNAVTRSVPKPGSFFHRMVKLKEIEPDFTDDLMLGQFFIFILAGFETTATALTFSLYLLARHNDVQEKARKEVEHVILKHGCTFDSLHEMVYLDYVMNEVLRLYTPVTGVVRISEKEYPLPEGHVIPKNTAVSFPFQSYHRDPRFFEDPEAFKPERWERPHKYFYPFGLGPRSCLGMKFALTEMKIFLSSLLMKYSISLDPATVEPLKFEAESFFIVPKAPIILNVHKRLSLNPDT